jgi:hypothetical protein
LHQFPRGRCSRMGSQPSERCMSVGRRWRRLMPSVLA